MKQFRFNSIFFSSTKLITVIIYIFVFYFYSFNQILAQSATGGQIILGNINGKDYYIHKFTTIGSHQFIANKNLSVGVLVVGGGGSGGGSYGAGGGAGGIIFQENYPIINQETISVTVGRGGNPVCGSLGESGANSSFKDLIAIGGGRGASGYVAGSYGGSGGGGGTNGYLGGQGVLGQGNNGGDGHPTGHGGGGGGGAGQIGYQGLSTRGGDGGDGTNQYSSLLLAASSGVEITGERWIGGGGAGGCWLGSGISYGGKGGGGNAGPAGTCSNGQNGIANTGGGGGGGTAMYQAQCGYGSCGGAGGSGIIIVYYPASNFLNNINDSNANIIPTKTSPNFTISGTVEYPEDGDATSVEVSATIGGINRSVVVPVSTNMTWQLSWSYYELTEGEYTNIEFTATSNSSTPEETTSTYTGKIIIDKTAPTCGSWSPAVSPWKVSGGEYFTLTSSSDTGGSGLATESISISCTTGPVHGDTCPVTIFDNASNDKICPSSINRVDIFAPNLTVTPAIIGWQGDKQDIIVTSLDEQTSINRIAYAWDLNTLGSDCSGGTTINSGDNLRLTISGGANPLYVCSIDLAGNVSTFTNVYQYIPPVFANPKVDKNVKPSNLYWNIQSVSETQSYVEVKGFFPKTTGNYHYALEYIIPTISKSYTQALRTSPFTETHFTILIPTTDFGASKDNHTFSGPQKLKITDLDQMEATTIDHNLSFFFPIHQSNHRKDFNYFILAGDNRLNEFSP